MEVIFLSLKRQSTNTDNSPSLDYANPDWFQNFHCIIILTLGIIPVQRLKHILTLFRLGFLRVAQLGGGGGGRKVPTAYNSKTINDNEMKLGGVVKDH